MSETSIISLRGTMNPRAMRNTTSSTLSGIKLSVSMSTAVRGFITTCRRTRRHTRMQMRTMMVFPYREIEEDLSSLITMKSFIREAPQRIRQVLSTVRSRRAKAQRQPRKEPSEDTLLQPQRWVTSVYTLQMSTLTDIIAIINLFLLSHLTANRNSLCEFDVNLALKNAISKMKNIRSKSIAQIMVVVRNVLKLMKNYLSFRKALRNRVVQIKMQQRRASPKASGMRRPTFTKVQKIVRSPQVERITDQYHSQVQSGFKQSESSRIIFYN